ncbi:hypothetical protein ICN84_00770 [Akkermansia glycaniphila]|uniref:hypothetical protein n=1 Tax=Akkermansia glycaniphila TaxID=1679444 RepID=UPI001C01951A|nr:hypothetical protein [Akkermansia glycaniphila]MBT9448604.1 hypothetical protein [Akkermansia glycaniphila]
MNIFAKEEDKVIEAVVAIGSVTYQWALDHLINLIDKTDFQRKLQTPSFYDKLKRDMSEGCVIPPITVAFVTEEVTQEMSLDNIKEYILRNVGSAFVLDGIQRLHILKLAQRDNALFWADKNEKQLFVNFIFCHSRDRLLYRMITLNNGQRPMTLRHQIEAMMSNIDMEGAYNIKTCSEKEGKPRDERCFPEASLIQAYLAYMTDSLHINNKKIIEEHMDQLLVCKVSLPPNVKETQFSDVLRAISQFQEVDTVYDWLCNENNLIGFSVAMRRDAQSVLSMTADECNQAIILFDSVFKLFDVSKIKLGKLRRELVYTFFGNINVHKKLGLEDLLDVFHEKTDE